MSTPLVIVLRHSGKHSVFPVPADLSDAVVAAIGDRCSLISAIDEHGETQVVSRKHIAALISEPIAR